MISRGPWPEKESYFLFLLPLIYMPFPQNSLYLIFYPVYSKSLIKQPGHILLPRAQCISLPQATIPSKCLKSCPLREYPLPTVIYCQPRVTSADYFCLTPIYSFPSLNQAQHGSFSIRWPWRLSHHVIGMSWVRGNCTLEVENMRIWAICLYKLIVTSGPVQT